MNGTTNLDNKELSAGLNSANRVKLEELQPILSERFGLSQFRSGQFDVICRLLSGQSAAAIFPTGGGKSLCYQLPAVLLDGLTLVVSPLLALMREQVGQLNQLGIAAARLDSTFSAQESNEVSRAVQSGQCKLLYVAPERFFNERFREMIQGLKIALFAVDEAHCISQWGHNFRPDYLKLAKIARQLEVQRVLALTATATPAVLGDICREFSIEPSNAVQTPFYRANLALRVQQCTQASRDRILIERLSSAGSHPAIVYVTLQKTTETVASQLRSAGFDARAYHAGLDAPTRRETQDWFMNSQNAVVVATIAFGMGIDKSNVRAIYHYNPSKSMESYAQEIGRAGRDGQPAACETLLVPEDRIVLENFAYADTPSLDSISRLIETLVGQPQTFFISLYSLAYEIDIRDSVLRTLLTYFELKGLIESTAPRYEVYQFKFRVDSKRILDHFQNEPRQFAGSVLALSVRKKIGFEINLATAATRLKCDRLRIVRMLDYFAQQDWIELEASGLVHGYRKLKSFGDIHSLIQELHTYAQDREASELARLDDLYKFFTSTSCLSALISDHFGQAIDQDCGHCSVCEGHSIRQLPEPEYGRLGDSVRTTLKKLRRDHPELMGQARQQARFLCGLTSPKMIRARLSRDASFGCCSSIPFDRVLDSLTETPV